MAGDKRCKAVRIVRIATTAAYAAFCFLAIAMLSTPDYETWWTGPEVRGPKPDYCYAPLPYDDDSGVGMLIGLILIAAVLVPGLIHLIRQRRISLALILAVVLLLYWAYAFFKQSIFC